MMAMLIGVVSVYILCGLAVAIIDSYYWRGWKNFWD